MASLMCFRPQKKLHSPTDEHATSRPDVSAINAAMVLAGPVEEGLTVQYVTPRLIVVTSPPHGTELAYKNSLAALVRHLKTKHALDYRVWNASRPRGDLACGVGIDNLVEVGWPRDLAPPLDRLCSVCKQFEQWLAVSPTRVVLIHAKGDSQRAAVLISAFMHYNVVCANDDPIDERFCMQRYVDRQLGGINGLPSNKRYIQYFTSLLSGKLSVNPSPVFLRSISLSRFTSGHALRVKIYERLQPVYESETILTEGPSTRLEPSEEVRLRGDVLVKCFEERDTSRRLLFSCQFNTCVFSRPAPKIAFLKEQLDGLQSDTSVDSQAVVEFTFVEQSDGNAIDSFSTISTTTTQRTSRARSNSYDDFGLNEDGDVSVEYSQIVKPGNTAYSSAGASSEDSGISGAETSKLALNISDDTTSSGSPLPSSSTQETAPSDRVRPNSRGMIGPPVPPKPRPSSAMGESSSDYGEMPERRGVLPASVKPLLHRPPSPKDAANNNAAASTRAIEPDLVGKDRYDKASKCFSYAPTKDLKQAFDRPRKKSFSINDDEDALKVYPEELSNVEIRASELARMPEGPKWTEEVDRARQVAAAEEENRWRSRPAPPKRSQSSIGDAYPHRYRDEEDERPTRKTSTGSGYGSMRRKPNYGSYRTLNDDYNSDMDDLCDPDFYLNYSQQPQRQEPPRSQSTLPHAGAKSVELPRKNRREMEDPLDSVLSYDNSRVARPVPAASMIDLADDDRDNFRMRNCRSVSHAPNPNDRRLFAEKYDAVESAAEPDNWLDLKLKKLKSKRTMDPDLVRRRTQEKMLLEELKNAHDDREVARNRREADYSVEGVGSRSVAPIDPLLEYKREEERLKNTNSPFEMDPRRTPRALRGKPPTPPPRERSRSPPGFRGASTSRFASTDALPNGHLPHHTPTSNHNGYGRTTLDYSHQQHLNGFDDDYSQGGDYSSLRGLSQNRPDSRPILKKASYNTLDFSRRSQTPTHFLSGQERVANAIMRAETPTHMNYYPNSTLDRDTPSFSPAEKKSSRSRDYDDIADRSETPAFPVSRETPLPFHPLLYNSTSNLVGGERPNYSATLNYRSSSPRSQYGTGLSRRSSLTSIDQSDVVNHHPIFVRDTSKYWYKPNISREEAIKILRDKQPGTFVIRDSNSFKGAFGLALKVDKPPAGVPSGDGTELVRHFLIEPSNKGVKLKGCNNEPVFGTLSALVYQHSMTPLALPCKLLLPEFDPATTAESLSATQALLEQGAACNVTYVGSVDCESLTGQECVRRAVSKALDDYNRGEFQPVSVHFKVSSQGVTLTDNTRKIFFRRHYPVNSVIFAGIDSQDRRFENRRVVGYQSGSVDQAKMFAFVARKFDRAENACHVFAEFEPEQPASAVVNFINKVMLAQRRQ